MANHIPVRRPQRQATVAVLDGGVTLLKISEEGLHRDGFTAGREIDDLIAAGAGLRDRGPTNVLISRTVAVMILTAVLATALAIGALALCGFTRVWRARLQNDRPQ